MSSVTLLGKCLHHRIGPDHFGKLHLHRTEVVREPSFGTDPIFPLQKKYRAANYTVEGLESKTDADATPIEDYLNLLPEVDDDMEGKKAVHHNPFQDMRLTKAGAKRHIDGSGTMSKAKPKWRPDEIPASLWRSTPDKHDTWRKMFPDERKRIYYDDDEFDIDTPVDDGSDIFHGVTDFRTGPKYEPKDRKSNYWSEADIEWISGKTSPLVGMLCPDMVLIKDLTLLVHLLRL